MRLVLVGRSGAGKSTSAALIKDLCLGAGEDAEIIKLAEPLYAVHDYVRSLVGIQPSDAAQDQSLMREVAAAMRRLKKRSLVDRFIARVDALPPRTHVINDDLRDVDTDLPILLARGFQFVRVRASHGVRSRRLSARGDLSSAEEVDRVIEEAVKQLVIAEVENDSDDLTALRRALAKILDINNRPESQC